MQLFASLANTELFASANNSNALSKRPAFPPTAVQLYSSKYIDFDSNTVLKINEVSKSAEVDQRRHQPLMYQAVRVSSGTAGDKVTPNLGVWNCRVSETDPGIVTSLLEGVLIRNNDNRKHLYFPTFVLALDLDESNAVQPSVANMIQIIVQYCAKLENFVKTQEEIGSPEEKENNDNKYDEIISQGTTNISVLRGKLFGKAPLDTDSEAATAVDVSSDINISIVICGIFSKRSKEENTYKEKQAVNLVSYHLQKYSSELNSTLCFIKDDVYSSEGNNEDNADSKDDDANKDQEMENDNNSSSPQTVSDVFRPKGIDAQEFASHLKDICTSTSTTVDEVDTQAETDISRLDESQQQLENMQHQPSIYNPYDYDVDLINSVLLRGASCPGIWNANTDSLQAALPPPNADKDVNKGGKEGTASEVENNSDNEWLSKLADSVSAYVGSSGLGGDGASVMDQSLRTTRTSANSSVATKKKIVKKKPNVAGEKGKDNQDVAEFFAGLLNK